VSGSPGSGLHPIVRLAPAKLNLTLAVIGRRSDGFHDLHSVFVPLALADRLSLAPAGGAEDRLHVSGGDAGPLQDNLVLRAIAAARWAVGQGPGRPATGPLAARLEKRIPAAAGLGGGSSDAAAALDGALAAWGAELDAETRLRAAVSLGSDVAFFLAGGSALVEGRGERVTPLGGIRPGATAPGVLLVTPAVRVATADVFAVFAATRGRGDGAVRTTSSHLAEELGRGLSGADLVARAGVLAPANDLLPASALVLPELVPLRRALARLVGRPIGLSGSGPTLWALYPSQAEAAEAARRVEAAVAAGTLATPGDGPPFVAATAILSATPTSGGTER
jgi:4-diphosphocytidyl-2-C-methyl-D-erythritol kinase